MNALIQDLKPRVDGAPLWDIVFGIIGYPALLVAHDLRVFEMLADGPRTLADIAGTLHIDERPAEAILSANVAMGTLVHAGPAFSLSVLAEDYLLQDSPTYFGGLLDALIANDYREPFERLKRAVQSNASQAYGGEEVFERHAQQAEHALAFTRAMHSLSMASALVWPDVIDLSGHHHLLDVGGGSGAHAIGAAQRWPDLKATVFDIEPVCEVAGDYIRQHALESRITTCVGDFWRTPFPRADIHFYSQIYHDWPLEKCRLLTEKSYASLPVGGRIILHELLYNRDKTGPFSAAASSIAMLLWTEGRQYSEPELAGLLEEAGFTGVETHPGYGDWSIVTAVKE